MRNEGGGGETDGEPFAPVSEETKDEWKGCYAGGWQGMIVPEAFSHPAKFAFGLVQRMVQHACTAGWMDKGALVLDPFGGVGCGGIVCAYAGIRWVGVELERRFVELAEQNFARHRRKWVAAGDPMPVMVQGDSRQLVQIGQQVQADAVLSSPPFVRSMNAGGGACYRKWCEQNGRNPDGPSAGTMGASEQWGENAANLGNMKPGDVDAVLSSPPYEGSIHDGNGIDRAKLTGNVPGRNSQAGAEGYGSVVGNIGNSTGETFWSAAREIVAACHAILKPGGHALWVTKDFVRDGRVEPFTEHWIELCRACGLELVCRHRAMLVAEAVDDGLFGQPVRTRKERKSFFRRLAEKKGSPPIDQEDVTCWVKL
jgi:hypothetical protein